jgi:hypothetical protein
MTTGSQPIKCGQQWVPTGTKYIKASCFEVRQVGGLDPARIFGHYIYDNGRVREGSMTTRTLLSTWKLNEKHPTGSWVA